MVLTNKLDLPSALVEAVRNDPYTRGDAEISITGLLKPARAVALERLHASELTEDVADRLWALYGQLMHKLLERGSGSRLTEERFYMTVDGVRVSGQVDTFCLNRNVLSDWKFTSAWKLKEGVPLEWEQQQNCYAQLLRENGYDVTALEIIGLLRDHSKLEAKRNLDYPQYAVVRRPVSVWPTERVVEFLRHRVSCYKSASASLPQCTAAERWEKPAKYAVMKNGGARAVKLYDNESDAKEHAARVGGYVDFRPADQVRCESYCAAAPFCAQFKELKARGK